MTQTASSSTASSSTGTTSDTRLPSPGVYDVDPAHTTVAFVARHLIGSKVRGRFSDFTGTITVGETPEQSKVEAEAKVVSIDTGVAQRDDHLRTNDFLDAETHPTITFVSTGLQPAGKGHWTMDTDLTIRGVTRRVPFDLEFLGSGPGMAPDSEVAAFEATADIDRRDFDVSFSAALDNGGLVVGNKVRIQLEVEASKR